MTDPIILRKSHPSPELVRLLNSARLDVPSQAAKFDTKTRALAQLRQQQLGTTTALSAVALGTTVSRLLGGITLVGAPVSPFRLALRGAFLGASLGVAALTVIAAGRWLSAPRQSEVGESAELAAPAPAAVSEGTWLHIEGLLTRAGAAQALSQLDALNRNALDVSARERATRLRVRALLLLGKRAEAEVLIQQTLAKNPSPELATSLEQLRREAAQTAL